MVYDTVDIFVSIIPVVANYTLDVIVAIGVVDALVAKE